MRKRILATILGCLLFSLNASGATTVIGTIADATGTGLLANGTIQFKLSQEGTVIDPLLLLQNPVVTCTITAGVIQSCSLRGNDEISPAGTVYRVQIFDADGITLLPARTYSITGATWDIGTQTPNPSSVQTGIHGESLHSGDIVPTANQDFGAFYSDFSQIAVPADPASGTRRLFVDSATGEISVRTSAGVTTSLEAGGGAGATHQIDGVDLTSQNPINFLDTPEFDWTNPAAGDLSLALKVAYLPLAGGNITGNVFITDGNGLVIGHTTQIDFGAIPEFQILGTGAEDSSFAVGRWGTVAGGPTLRFLKSRNATIGSFTIVQDGDELGRIRFQADDGTDYNSNAAEISVEVDGTPGVNDMPGRIIFSTTPDGSSSLVERMAITSSGTFVFEAGAIDPVWTPASNVMNLSTGTLQQAGTAVGLVGTCTNQFVRAVNNSAPTCESIADADLPSTNALDTELHAQSHVLDGADHTVSGLTIGNYIRALTASTFGFAAILDADLPATIARDSELHTQSHVLAGSDHTASGLTVGQVPRATSASAFAWQQLGFSDLGGSATDAQVDGSAEADELVLAGDVDGTANANDLDELAVEAELEAVLDHDQLQLAGLTAGQVYRATAATTAGWGALDLADADARTGLLPDANLADVLANTIMLRNAGTTGVRADVKISALTEEATPLSGDWILGETAEGNLRRYNVGNLPTGGGGEANTHSSDGGGLALTAATPKVGVDLRLVSMAAADFDLASDLFTIDDSKWAKDSELHTIFSPNADPGVDHSGLSGGVGISEVGGAIAVDLLTADDQVGSTSNQSGLEFGGAGSDKLGLLRGCALNEILKFNTTGGLWECAADADSGGSPTLDAITAAAGANSINNGDNAQVWNFSLTTADKVAFKFGENTASVATGNPVILNVATLAASTAHPFQATSRGTANGVRVGATDGILVALGTGGLDWLALLNYPSGCTNQFLRAISDTPTCNTVGTADIAGNAADNTIIRDSAGFSVIGKTATGTGDPADIVAADETVLGRTAAGNLVFAQVATGQIAANAITYAKIQNISATDRLLGRDTAGSGVIEELTVGGGVEFTGSGGIQRSALTGDVTASAGSNATSLAAGVVASPELATANKTFKCNFALVRDTGLKDSDDWDTVSNCSRPGRAITITEVIAETDAGSPVINLQRDDGTPANLLSSNCTATTGGATCSIAAAEDNFAATDKLDFVAVSGMSGANRISILIEYTVD